ncbi:MAG: N-formylglutamate amidohydrolase [Candidatus Eisenbacteria bacterium]
MSPSRPPVVVTCEHGGNRIPKEYRALFAGADDVLRSHRGWDPGALLTGRALARSTDAPFVEATVTRLLVDLNRTKDGAGRFSEFTRELPEDERRRILSTYHDPHWRSVRRAISAARRGRRSELVIHIASHSFTAHPGRIGGKPRPDRSYEVGLLYDPSRPGERSFAERWRRAILSSDPELRVRMNLPYRGWTDGMTSVFRAEFGSGYVGIELECNQETLARPDSATRLRRVLSSTLPEVVSRTF